MFEDTKGIIRCHTSKDSSLGFYGFCVGFCPPWFSFGPFSFVLRFTVSVCTFGIFKLFNVRLYIRLDYNMETVVYFEARSQDVIVNTNSSDLFASERILFSKLSISLWKMRQFFNNLRLNRLVLKRW